VRAIPKDQRILIYAGGRHGVGHSIRAARMTIQLLERYEHLTAFLLVSTTPNIIESHPRMTVYQLKAVKNYVRDIHEIIDGLDASSTCRAYREPTISEAAAATREILHIVNRFRPSAFMSTQLDGLVGELVEVLPVLRKLHTSTVLLAREYADFEYHGRSWFREVLSLYDDVQILGDEWSLRRTHPDLVMRINSGTASLAGFVLPQPSIPQRAESDGRLHVLVQFGGGAATQHEPVEILHVLGHLPAVERRLLVVHLYPGVFNNHAAIGLLDSFKFVHMLQWSPNAWQARKYDLTISRAGYNSAMEAYVRNEPTVLRPWRLKGAEQSERAEYMNKVSPLVSATSDPDELDLKVRAALLMAQSDLSQKRKVPLKSFDGRGFASRIAL
jgi:predicted glycosyltransferase